jgi:predicted GIY-YIG superfamily endonuclease
MVKISRGEQTPWGVWDGRDLCVVYVLDCGEAGYYVGHTCNLLRRLTQHYTKRGSWFTKKHGVQGVKWVSHVYSRRDAAKLEYYLKFRAAPNPPSEISYIPVVEQ